MHRAAAAGPPDPPPRHRMAASRLLTTTSRVARRSSPEKPFPPHDGDSHRCEEPAVERSWRSPDLGSCEPRPGTTSFSIVMPSNGTDNAQPRATHPPATAATSRNTSRRNVPVVAFGVSRPAERDLHAQDARRARIRDPCANLCCRFWTSRSVPQTRASDRGDLHGQEPVHQRGARRRTHAARQTNATRRPLPSGGPGSPASVPAATGDASPNPATSASVQGPISMGGAIRNRVSRSMTALVAAMPHRPASPPSSKYSTVW